MLTFDNGYSPLLSLFTGTFEVGLAIWALRGPGRRRIVRPIALLLLILSGYQFIEIFACHQPDSSLLGRLGFVDVVWLPPLSLWLLLQYARPRAAWPGHLIRASFLGALALSIWVLAFPDFVTGTVCQMVVATYQKTTPWYNLYGAFYEITLFGIVFGSIAALVEMDDPVGRRHTAELLAGTVGFMLPSYVTQVAWRSLDPSIPSLMCHYALILAFLLWRTLTRERREGAASRP